MVEHREPADWISEVGEQGWSFVSNFKIYLFGYYLGKRNPSFDIVTEFQSPNFHERMSLLFAAGVLVFVTLGVRRCSFNIVEGLLAAAFTLQAFVSVRQMSTAAPVLAPLLALALCERFVWARELPPPLPDREATIARVEAAA